MRQFHGIAGKIQKEKDRRTTFEATRKTVRRRQSAVETSAVLNRRILRRQTTALSRTTSTLFLRRPVSDSATSLCNPFPYSLFSPRSSIFFLRFLQLLDSAPKHTNRNQKARRNEVDEKEDRLLTLRIGSERGWRAFSGFDGVRLMKEISGLRLKKLDEGFEFDF